MNIVTQPHGIADYTDPLGAEFRARVLEDVPAPSGRRSAESDRIAAEVAEALGLGTNKAMI